MRSLSSGNYSEASTFLTMARREAEQLADRDLRMALTISQIAHLRSVQGDWQQAIELYNKAIPTMKLETSVDDDYGPVQRELVHALWGMAKSLSAQGKYAEAEKQFESTLKLLDGWYGRAQSDYAMKLLLRDRAEINFDLAQDLVSDGKREEAAERLRLALSLACDAAIAPDLVLKIDTARENMEKYGRLNVASLVLGPSAEKQVADRSQRSNNPRVAAWHELYSVGLSALTKRDFNLAEGKFRECLDLAEHLPDLKEYVVPSLFQLATAYQLAERYRESEACLTTGISVAKGADALEFMTKLAAIYERQGKLQRAEQMYVDVTRRSREKAAYKHFAINAFEALGRIYYADRTDYDKAVQIYWKTLSFLGESDLTEANYVLGKLVKVYSRSGKVKETESCYEKILANQNKMQDLSSSSRAATLRGLADLQFDCLPLERMKAALNYERALAILVNDKSEDTLLSRAQMMQRVGIVYTESGVCLDRAKEYLESSLAIRKQNLPPDDPLIVSAVSSLGALGLRQQEPRQVEKLCLDFLKTVPNWKKPDGMAPLFGKLATATFMQHRYREAITWSEHGLSVCRGLSRSVLSERMGDSYLELHEYRTAEKCYRTALNLRSDSDDVVPVLKLRIATCCMQQGRVTEAERYGREANHALIREKRLKSKQLTALVGWGTTLYAKGRYSQAVATFERIISLLSKSANEINVGYSRALCFLWLGKSNATINPEKAVNCFKRALREFQNADGKRVEVAVCHAELAHEFLRQHRDRDAELSALQAVSVIEQVPGAPKASLNEYNALLEQIRQAVRNAKQTSTQPTTARIEAPTRAH